MSRDPFQSIILDAEHALRAVVGIRPELAPFVTLARPWLDDAARSALEDLWAFARRDAAAMGDPDYVLATYRCFRAVLGYRVSNLIHRRALSFPAGDAVRFYLVCLARGLSELMKVETGVEIHPAASIGARFVIDHGLGTVIGEQVRLGTDCYLLQDVVLGGAAIADSSLRPLGSRRHPDIGDRVEMGAGVRVLGPITVGDDCWLGPGVTVTNTLPAHTRVKLVNTTQMIRGDGGPTIQGAVMFRDTVLIVGVRLGNLVPTMLDATLEPIHQLKVVSSGDSYICCHAPERQATGSGSVTIGLLVGGRISSWLLLASSAVGLGESADLAGVGSPGGRNVSLVVPRSELI
ncbi:serine O-acetyltransferase [Parafrankia sp. EUN1f]|uniref:serine O-acetyltransferase n=1 Tax=Parafrankia sp. EUN1f TaxID=102897 RepID=UPI0001C452C4|nr:serine acetyltransferase [Parafrankia sp. EUN1f]EFC79053.1 Serine acetyltransferase-like protein [Parafrankia sp. EUN1f]